MAYRFRMIEGFDVEHQLKSIKAPTLVLSGEKDVFVSPRSLQALSEQIPNVTVACLPNCGHLGFVTKPDLVMRKVDQFLTPDRTEDRGHKTEDRGQKT